MIRVRDVLPVLLGACVLGAMMTTTPGFDDVFRPIRTTAQSGAIAQGRMYAARFADWQTADRLSFDRYGTPVTRDTQGVFLIIDVDISNVRESVSLTATWQGRSGRQYFQTTRAQGAPSTLDARQFHPGLDDQGRAVFELPRDEIKGGKLLLARKGPNMLDSELALTPTADAALPHNAMLRMQE